MSSYQEVLDACLEMELVVSELKLDGEWHRVKVKKKNDRANLDGAYCLRRLPGINDLVVGVATNWYTGDQQEFTVKTGLVAQLSREERLEASLAMEELRKEQGRAQVDKQSATAERAAKIWSKLPEAGAAPYLQRKRVKGYGVRFSRGSVVVPVRDVDGRLWSLQFIRPEKDPETGRDKTFLSGGRKKGCFHLIHDGDLSPSPYLIGIAEGYATGATLFEAAAKLVEGEIALALAFDSGNLPAVAQALRERYPDAQIVVFGDDDRFRRNGRGELDNVGRKKAEAAARAVGGRAVLPDFSVIPDADDLSDFNDLAHRDRAEFQRQLKTALSHAQRSFRGEGEPPGDLPPIAAYADDIPPWPKHRGDWEWLDRLTRNDKGAVTANMSNVALIFEHDPEWRGVLAYDEFAHRIVMHRSPPMAGSMVGEWGDGDTARAHIWLARHYGIRVSDKDLEGAILVTAEANAVHPVRDYLESLRGQWDGESRLRTWLNVVFTAEGDARYLEAVGVMWPVSAVARILRPGCKVDSVLILEGDQGLKKSTALKVLAGEWFSDAPMQLGDKDSYQLIQGVWVYELAELDALNKSEVTTAKAFFSQQHDRFRPPFAKSVKEFKRQCVVVGTTNQDEYLRDYSGNRRYWPVHCTRRTDLDWIRRNRTQLWAEAVYRFDQGEEWWIESEALGRVFDEEQQKRLQRDPWEAIIQAHIDYKVKGRDYVTSDELLTEAIGFTPPYIQQIHQQRISRIMRGLGYRKGRRDCDGRRRQVYLVDSSAVAPVNDDPFPGERG